MSGCELAVEPGAPAGQLAWLTDLHFEAEGVLSADPLAYAQWQQSLERLGALLHAGGFLGVVVSGDLATPEWLPHALSWLRNQTAAPIYVVNGNHEVWGHSRQQAVEQWAQLGKSSLGVVYLPSVPYVVLSPSTALVGVDGWFDFRAGRYSPRLTTKDWSKVPELCFEPEGLRIAQCRAWADADTVSLAPRLEAALAQYAHVVLVTHVPPFAEATWRNGAPSRDEWLPWVTNVGLGEYLRGLPDAFPATTLTVCCGHTHGDGMYAWHTRGTVRTARGDYGHAVLHQLAVHV